MSSDGQSWVRAIADLAIVTAIVFCEEFTDAIVPPPTLADSADLSDFRPFIFL
jgi:hypothetical protein